jgi:hypothetical protein
MTSRHKSVLTLGCLNRARMTNSGAPYQQVIKLPGYSFALDFTVSSAK